MVSYKVFIGRGNNRTMLQKYFKARWWWIIVDADQKYKCNFMWS